MKKYTFIYPIVLLAIFVLAPMVAMATPPPDDPTPIDGGATLLVGAAVAYGVKKYRNKKREAETLDK